MLNERTDKEIVADMMRDLKTMEAEAIHIHPSLFAEINKQQELVDILSMKLRRIQIKPNQIGILNGVDVFIDASSATLYNIVGAVREVQPTETQKRKLNPRSLLLDLLWGRI